MHTRLRQADSGVVRAGEIIREDHDLFHHQLFVHPFSGSFCSEYDYIKS
jgi:hypothetical protein